MENTNTFKLREGSLFTVLSTEKGKQGKYTVIIVTVQCKCGTIKKYPKSQIVTGTTINCGCNSRKTSFVHGYSKHQLYTIWMNMMGRCYKPIHDYYHLYGGKGITVCDEWKNDVVKFIQWGLSNDWVQGLTIDRIKNSGNYAPDNCRFVTQEVNNNNRSTSRFLTYKGRTQTTANWAKELNIPQSTLRARLNRSKWSIEKTLETPI